MGGLLTLRTATCPLSPQLRLDDFDVFDLAIAEQIPLGAAGPQFPAVVDCCAGRRDEGLRHVDVVAVALGKSESCPDARRSNGVHEPLPLLAAHDNGVVDVRAQMCCFPVVGLAPFREAFDGKGWVRWVRFFVFSCGGS